MALSGTVNTTTYQGRYVQLTWTATQNVANNTSTISWTLKGAGNATSSYYMSGPFEVIVNGDTKTFNSRIKLYNGTSIGTGSSTISHNNDGAKSFSISVRAAIYSSAYNQSGSGTFTLNTIARTTTPTLSNANPVIGNSITINTPRASSDFTHTLRYHWGSTDATIATGVTTGTTWTLPMDLCNALPNSTAGWGVIYCDTYNGSTLIGTKSVRFDATVPTSVVPSIDNISISEGTAGIASKFSAYIQNKSTLNVAITAIGSYGSTVKNYETYIQDVPYRAASFTSAVITISGTIAITTTVTDSRGRTANATNYVTIQPYSSPVISSMSVWRIDNSGNDDNNGERIAVHMVFTISPIINLTDRSYILKYKKSSESEDSFVVFRSSNAGTNVDVTQRYHQKLSSSDPPVPIISGDYAYTIRLEIKDYFETVTYDFEVPTAFTLIDYRSTGKGMAFGKVSEKDALEVAMDVEFTKSVKFGDKTLIDLIYPVNSIYMSTNDTSPSTFIGGTWEQLKDRFLLGAGDTYSAPKIGGEAEHKLDIDEIPSHRHNLTYTGSGTSGKRWSLKTIEEPSYSITGDFMGYTGGGKAHNNMPPYLVVYMWKRIA